MLPQNEGFKKYYKQAISTSYLALIFLYRFLFKEIMFSEVFHISAPYLVEALM